MLARRHALDACEDPEYEAVDVPRAAKNLKNSITYSVTDRAYLLKCMPEMLNVCNLAAVEFERTREDRGEIVVVPGKPLGLEFIADRLYTDDPIQAWMVRTKNTKWLQGFACVTTFTTWLRFFKWESMREEGGLYPYANVAAEASKRFVAKDTHTKKKKKSVSNNNKKKKEAVERSVYYESPNESEAHESDFLDYPESDDGGGADGGGDDDIATLDDQAQELLKKGRSNKRLRKQQRKPLTEDEKAAKLAEWKSDRICDASGKLARRLNACLHGGDHNGEGVVWPRVAELSLLGARGCGGRLLDQAVDFLQQSGKYDFMVLQATENAVPFYESRGFVRVGASARYRRKRGAGPSVSRTSASSTFLSGRKTDSTPFFVYEINDSRRKTTLVDVCEEFENEISLEEVLFLNRASIVDELLLRKPDGEEEEEANIDDDVVESIALPIGFGVKIPILFDYPECDDAVSSRARELPERISVDVSKCGEWTESKLWYVCAEGDTPKEIAAAAGLEASLLVSHNRTRLPELSQNSYLIQGTILKRPDALPIFFDDDDDDDARSRRLSPQSAEVEAAIAKALEDFSTEDDIFWTPRAVEGHSDAVPYRHWTFADEQIEYSSESYMMAKQLAVGAVGKKKKKWPSKSKNNDFPIPWDYDFDPKRDALPPGLSKQKAIREPFEGKRVSVWLKRSNQERVELGQTSNAKGGGGGGGGGGGARNRVSSSLKRLLGVRRRNEIVSLSNCRLLNPPLKAFLSKRIRVRVPQRPLKPTRPASALGMFSKETDDDSSSSQSHQTKWKNLPFDKRRIYIEKSVRAEFRYASAVQAWERAVEAWDLKWKPVVFQKRKIREKERKVNTTQSGRKLFNKVVALRPKKSALARARFLNLEQKEATKSMYEYYFVLTYIPDLDWVRLVPMDVVGKFVRKDFSSIEDKDERKAQLKKRLNRPKYKLIRNAEHEIDCGASRCDLVDLMVGVKQEDDCDNEIFDLEDFDFEADNLLFY